jgi:hypothetical protein
LILVETYDATLVGKVVAGSQFPQAGTEQDQGTSVIYDYYVQKAFVTVPNLVDTLEEDIFDNFVNHLIYPQEQEQQKPQQMQH